MCDIRGCIVRAASPRSTCGRPVSALRLVLLTVMLCCGFWSTADAQQISTGPNHTCTLVAYSHLMCFGAVQHGRLLIKNPQPVDQPFVHVATAAGFVCAITQIGNVRCWGLNPFLVRDDLVPESSTDIWTMVAVGNGFACHLHQNGTLHCRGLNDQRQCEPPLIYPDRVVMVSAGEAHACAVTAQAKLYCWGSNQQAQRDFTHIAFMNKSDVVWVRCGSHSTCAITRYAQPACWGSRLPPVDPSLRVVEIAPGSTMICAILLDAKIVCWGDSVYGTSPIDISPSSSFGVVRQLALGLDHACAIQGNEALLRCWGSNRQGQTNVNPSEFFSVSTPSPHHTSMPCFFSL